MAVGDTFTVGDYTYTVTEESQSVGSVSVEATSKSKSSYSDIPATVTRGGVVYTVRNTQSCFKDCVNLVSAPKFDVGNVLYATRMFQGCTSLVNPPNMGGLTKSYFAAGRMFAGCTSLTKPPTLPRPTASQANYFNYGSMFEGCTSLLRGPDMSSYTGNCNVYLAYMFLRCSSLKSASLPALINGPAYQKDKGLAGVFQGCSSLGSAPDMPGDAVGSMEFCFQGCSSIANPPAIPSGITDMRNCFQYCESLAKAPAIPGGVTNLYACFGDCSSLVNPPSIPNTVTDMRWCFAECHSLTRAPSIPNGVTNLYACFKNCTSLAAAPSIPSGVTSLGECFMGCTKITAGPSIPEGVKYINETFRNCTSLKTAPRIPSTVEEMVSCFNGCSSLKTPPDMSAVSYIPEGTPIDDDVNEGMYRCFKDCASLETPPTIPEGVIDMFQMFQGCKSLKSAPAIPSTATTVENCFYGCSSLATPPDMSRATRVTNMDCTFFNCRSLKSAPTLPASVADVDWCFYGCSSLTGTVLAKCTPTEREGVFDGTREPIFIVLDGAADETTWRTIAGQYENVFFFADANSKPALSFEAKRVAADQDTAEDTGGTWVYVTATATAYKDRLPEGYGNSIVSLAMRANGQAESVTWQVVSTEEVDFKVTRVYRGWFEATTAKQALAMTVTDEYAATSPTITAVLASTRKLLNLLRGSLGMGLAIGKRATREGFDCALPAYFDDVEVEGDLKTVGHVLDANGNQRYLPLSGGTMAGNTYVANTDIDRDAAANPSGQVGRQLVFNDKDGERIGLVRVDRNAGGYMALKLGAFTENSSNQEVGAWLSLTKARDGDPFALMPKPVVRDMGYSASGNPSSNRYMTIIEGQDSTGAERAYVRQTATTDGWQGAQIEAHRGSVYNGLRLEIDANGNRRVLLSDAPAWRSGIGLGSLATKDSAGLAMTSKDGTASSTAARSANTNFTIDVTLDAVSGYTPISVVAVKLNAGPATVTLRGYDMDGLSSGGTPVVHTYWHTSAAIASGTTVTAYAQVMYLRGTAS